MQQFLAENLVGQRGLDLPDAVLGKICLSRFHRPCHHVDVGMISLVMERSVPAEVLRWDLHRRGDVIAVGTQQCAPRVRMVIAQPLRVLPVEGDDVRPHVAGVVFQFIHDSAQIHVVIVTEQTVFTQPLRSRPQGDVLGVAFHALHPIPIRFQRQRDERGRGCFGWVRRVVLIFHQLFYIRKILHQLLDELLLLARGRTVIRDDLHPLPRRDVLEVPADTFSTAALDVRAFDDQPCRAEAVHPPRCGVQDRQPRQSRGHGGADPCGDHGADGGLLFQDQGPAGASLLHLQPRQGLLDSHEIIAEERRETFRNTAYRQS